MIQSQHMQYRRNDDYSFSLLAQRLKWKKGLETARNG